MSADPLVGLAMLAGLIVIIFAGFPIAFTVLFTAFFFGYLGLGARVFDIAQIQIVGLMSEEAFVAVPLFIFMGFVVDQARLMERMFLAFRLLFAPLPGALYLGVLLTATVFAMATGIVGAAVAVMGVMAGSMMIRYGYSPTLSAGAITAGGTLGILIPPSVMLIVMAPVISVSSADLYLAAFGPGFLLAGLYIAYCLARCLINPRLGPPVPLQDRVPFSVVLREFAIGVVPLALLMLSTLGTIIAGIATPTEASGMGAVGSLLLAAAFRKLNRSALRVASEKTISTTGMVMFLAVASAVFGAIFARLGSADLVVKGLIGLEIAAPLMLSLLLGLIFLLGWPFEWPAIVLVFLPILWPVFSSLGYHPLFLGAMIAVCLQTAFLSPPVAMSAYYLKQVVPEWSLGTIFRGMYQFMVIQLVCLVLIYLFPGIVYTGK